MTRMVMVLLFGLVMEAVGVVLISKGQKALLTQFEPRVEVVAKMAREALTSPALLLGVALEAGFFGCLLFLLSRFDVSLVWPLTSLSLVITTLTARIVLHEQVSGLRWAGVGFILLGAAIVLYTENHKPRPASTNALEPRAASPGSHASGRPPSPASP